MAIAARDRRKATASIEPERAAAGQVESGCRSRRSDLLRSRAPFSSRTHPGAINCPAHTAFVSTAGEVPMPARRMARLCGVDFTCGPLSCPYYTKSAGIAGKGFIDFECIRRWRTPLPRAAGPGASCAREYGEDHFVMRAGHALPATAGRRRYIVFATESERAGCPFC